MEISLRTQVMKAHRIRTNDVIEVLCAYPASDRATVSLKGPPNFSMSMTEGIFLI